MDLLDSLQQLANRLPRLRETIQTEEGTKNALVMPVLQALGYNVFDPFEVVPEYTSDVGTKKGEKVDYVLMKEGKPAVLLECKALGAELSINHASQLYRYFSCTDARIGILTNGEVWQFYTDIEAPNKMDDKPFFEFELGKVDARAEAFLRKIGKSSFNIDNILSNAAELKYKKAIRKILNEQLETPSEDFVRFFARQIYEGILNSTRMERFSALVQQAFGEWVNLKISEKLQTALDGVTPTDQEEPQQDETPVSASTATDDGIVTTPEEIEGFHIVRAILAQIIDPDRIRMKDTKSYCGVLLDYNVRKPLCRFLFTANQTTLILVDKERNEKRIPLAKVSDIGKHAAELLEYAKLYL